MTLIQFYQLDEDDQRDIYKRYENLEGPDIDFEEWLVCVPLPKPLEPPFKPVATDVPPSETSSDSLSRRISVTCDFDRGRFIVFD